MRNKVLFRFAVAVMFVSGMFGATRYVAADEEEYHGHDEVRALRQQGEILSLEDILARAQRQHQGRIIETELKHRDTRYIYEIEILDVEGRVWEMKFDAHNGGMLKDKREK